MPITRRDLLGLLSSSTFFLTVSPGATAMAGPEAVTSPLRFPQGVASGDPQPHAVMLWTRAVPQQGISGDINLLLQICENPEFEELLLQEQLQTGPASDYTLRAYIDGLEPDTRYYYRFLGAGDSVSRTGRTRTAPSPDQARKVNLAFVSCQNFEQAHYGSWARMLADDTAAPEEEQIQFVLHLGDFIYERCWKTRPDGNPQARTVPPFPDGVDTPENRYAVSLADYRHLYNTYLSDPHLQEARARWPFICTWDDHEFANDNFQSFSTYGGKHQLEAQRKLWANQAWFEFIPCILDELKEQPAHDFRPAALGDDESTHNATALDSLRIYRKLGWGKYLDLVLTDSRSYRSPPCVSDDFARSLDMTMNSVELVEIADAGRAYNNGNPPQLLPFGDGTVPNPARDRAPGSLLGEQQRQWFLDSLDGSGARWKLWGNALPLIPMRLDMSTLPLVDFQDSIFTLDPWAGYPFEVSLMMNHLHKKGVTGLVSLSGDHHMHGAGTISHSASDSEAPAVAVDFNVAGISSSPLFEDLLSVARKEHPDFEPLVFRRSGDDLEPVWNMSLLYGVLAAYAYSKTGMAGVAQWLAPNEANPGLQFVSTTVNGYGLASFEADELKVQLVAISDCVADFEQPPEIAWVANFTLPEWQAGEEPTLQGPTFTGARPFPFGDKTV